MKSTVPVDTETLKKSLARRAKVYQSAVSMVVVGPRTNFIREVNGKKRWATKYAHLVEKGSSHAPGKHFMSKAADASKAESAAAAQNVITEALRVV
jgi:HK97 gp10 family phage protein